MEDKNTQPEIEEEDKSILKKILDILRKAVKDMSGQEVLNLFLWSTVVNLIIETLGRMKYSGFLGGIFSIFQEPYVFFYNVLIIMATISISLLFKRKYFVMSLLSVVWLGFGMANFILLSYRVTPFSAVELKLLDAALGVMKSYVSITTLLVVILVCVLVIGGIILIWKKAAVKKSVNYISGMLIIMLLVLGVNLTTRVGVKVGALQTQFPNLADAYVDYGFVYCFSNSLINTGIQKPKDYSTQKVEQIQASVDEKLGTTSEPKITSEPSQLLQDSNKPNIIFLQLESFFDITALKDLKLSEDPIPNFRSMTQNYSSGFLNVPVVGAGTANTEFEIITGMDLDFFGPGEYPYKTVLKNRTCETICYDLKYHGYKTQAMHNNRATFYSRNEVFSRLGFDIFTSIELMNVQEYTQNGWAKDIVLKDELVKALTATPEKDFVYTISVQGHGSYPTQPSLTEQKIKVLDGVEDEGRKNEIQYYVNQINEMDAFLAALVNALDALDENTIVVAYGDHLPNLGIKEEDLASGTLYQTQYIIWNNCNLKVQKEDVEAYQLTSRVMEGIGISDGVVNAFHQMNKEKKNTQEYLDDLKVLGYDQFYGDHISTGGENIYQPTTIKYGVEDVSITDVFRDQSDTEYLIIKGKNFTKYSKVFVDDEEIECELLDVNTLRVRMDKVKDSITVLVKQSYKGKLTLQTSNSIVYNGAGESEYMDQDVINEGTQSPKPTSSADVQSQNIDWGSLIDEAAAEKSEKK